MLSKAAIASHPQLLPILKRQAQAFLDVEQAEPRVAAIFGTHQRYLMGQLAVAMFLENGDKGVLLTHYLDAVVSHGIASRNTAHDFILEMIRYGLGYHCEPHGDRRARPIFLAPLPRQMIALWTRLHLETLDALDDGRRLARYEGDEELVAKVHPRIARRLLSSAHATRPEGTFSLFTWMNDGGLVMDKMISTLADSQTDADRWPTGVTSFRELAEPLRTTRTHLARKMAVAERAGSIGWTGKRGASALWLSTAFIGEYVDYQSEKLAHIDEAFEETG